MHTNHIPFLSVYPPRSGVVPSGSYISARSMACPQEAHTIMPRSPLRIRTCEGHHDQVDACSNVWLVERGTYRTHPTHSRIRILSYILSCLRALICQWAYIAHAVLAVLPEAICLWYFAHRLHHIQIRYEHLSSCMLHLLIELRHDACELLLPSYMACAWHTTHTSYMVLLVRGI